MLPADLNAAESWDRRNEHVMILTGRCQWDLRPIDLSAMHSGDLDLLAESHCNGTKIDRRSSSPNALEI